MAEGMRCGLGGPDRTGDAAAVGETVISAVGPMIARAMVSQAALFRVTLQHFHPQPISGQVTASQPQGRDRTQVNSHCSLRASAHSPAPNRSYPSSDSWHGSATHGLCSTALPGRYCCRAHLWGRLKKEVDGQLERDEIARVCEMSTSS